MKRIILAQPRALCRCQRSRYCEKSIDKFGSPVYVRHEIVHNKHVVDSLTEKGAIFVDEILDIPDNSNTIFSAHGVSDKVETDAKIKSLSIVDATCPLVKKVHVEALKYYEQGYKIILVGTKVILKWKVQLEECLGVKVIETVDHVNKLKFSKVIF